MNQNMPSSAPDTRNSLLLRLRQTSDQDAWQEFEQIYRPVIVRLALHKGLQVADAEDLAQQVMLSVSKAIERWQPDADRARFRTWLHRVTHNAILNALRQSAADNCVAVDPTEMLQDQPAPSGPDSELLRIESRRQILLWAAGRVRSEVAEGTWMAFWRTAVDQQPVERVARDLGLSTGSVYAARSRVMRRLRLVAEEFTETEET